MGFGFASVIRMISWDNVKSSKIWILLAAVLFGLMICQPLAHAQIQKVRISISSRSNTSVSFYVAVSKGFFRDEGMDVEIIQANPRLGVMALMNGDVSFTGTFVSTVRGILSGFPLKIVVVAFKKGVYYLIAHPSVKDIQELKGKSSACRVSAARIIWSQRSC